MLLRIREHHLLWSAIVSGISFLVLSSVLFETFLLFLGFAGILFLPFGIGITVIITLVSPGLVIGVLSSTLRYSLLRDQGLTQGAFNSIALFITILAINAVYYYFLSLLLKRYGNNTGIVLRGIIIFSITLTAILLLLIFRAAGILFSLTVIGVVLSRRILFSGKK